MQINKLNVTGLRALNQAEFEFKPGMNLLVGVNGVGKTTALDALRFCLSRVFLALTSQRLSKVPIESTDIRIGSESVQVECEVEYQGYSFELLLLKQRHAFIEGKEGEVREQIIERDDKEVFSPPNWLANFPDSKKSDNQPIGVYYSVRRSLAIDQKQSTADAFSANRDFNLRELAEWMHVKEILGEEDPKANSHVEALRRAADLFLPEYSNLRVVEKEGIRSLEIEKNGTLRNVRQLSDGERGVLALALDLARRLSLANPTLANPVEKGQGIVLIDELDLHLHPKWQRTIVENLIRTFPKCQFIATTHSPQIIPSVEPEHVILMKEGEIVVPDRTYGMDSNWILRFLMDVEDRPEKAVEAIKIVEKLILEGNFSAARDAMAKYKAEELEPTEWAVFEARMARMEILKS